MKPIVEQSIVAFIFGGSIGIFGGLLIFINEQTHETNRLVTRMQIVQETDKQVLIEELASIKTEIHNQQKNTLVPIQKETLRELEKEREKIRNHFKPWEQRSIND